MPITKPSSAWRTGGLLYDGWPAQEGGTDSHGHGRRTTHDLFCPSVVVAETPPAPSPARMPWSARYPAWWTEQEPTPADTLPFGAATTALAPPLPPQPRPPLPPQALPETPEPQPPAPKTTIATQTAIGHAAVQRSPLMPCVRPQQRKKPAAAPATSRVGERLRREAAYRDQLAAARRRRLQAVLSGAHPDDAPIATGVPASRVADTAPWLGAVGPTSAEEEAAAALAIAQRFLGSSLGGHFVSAATGSGASRPFEFHEPRFQPPPPRTLHETDSARAAEVAGEAEAAVPTPWHYEPSAEAAAAAVAARLEPPVLLDEAAAAAARYGLHEEGYEDEDVAAGCSVTLPPPSASYFEDWPVASRRASARPASWDEPSEEHAPSRALPPPPPAAGPAAPAGQVARREPAAWEVDVSELRKPPPSDPPPPVREPPPPLRTLLRSRPAAEGHRSHAGWIGDFTDPKTTRSGSGGAGARDDPVAHLVAGLEDTAAGLEIRNSSASWWDVPLAEESPTRLTS